MERSKDEQVLRGEVEFGSACCLRCPCNLQGEMSVWGHRREVWAEDQGLVWSSDNGSLEKERERGLNGTFCWGKVLVWLVMGEANGGVDGGESWWGCGMGEEAIRAVYRDRAFVGTMGDGKSQSDGIVGRLLPGWVTFHSVKNRPNPMTDTRSTRVMLTIAHFFQLLEHSLDAMTTLSGESREPGVLKCSAAWIRWEVGAPRSTQFSPRQGSSCRGGISQCGAPPHSPPSSSPLTLPGS